MSDIQKQARWAGILYLLGVLPSPFSLLYVPGALIVSGDAAATADHVRASGALLRLGLGAEMFSAIMVIFAVMALYRLLKDVNPRHAALMVILWLISVPITCLNVLTGSAALTLAGGGAFLSAFQPAQLDALVLLSLRLHNTGFAVAQIFWGLWLVPYGLLIMRSGFIPRVLGILQIIAGCAYVVSSATLFLLPHYLPLVSRAMVPLEAGEAPLILWLVIFGAKAPPLARVPAASPSPGQAVMR
jgi:Domain of unknown function (DUF4386)